MAEDIETMGSRLTKAQREAMIEGFVSSERFGGTVYASMKTARSLRLLGLIGGWRNTISPLGLAVRAHLEENPK